MEAWCWGVVIPLGVLLCAAARRPAQISNSGIWPPQGASHCFTCPGLHPIGLPWGVDHPHLTVPGKNTVGVRWCVVACTCVRACVCVACTRIRPRGDFPAATSRGESERSSCTAKEHSNLQYNGMQWDIVDHRCFIIYLFTIIGRGFCPFASV